MSAAEKSTSAFPWKGVFIVAGILFALAALAALLLPQITSARETARANTCRSHMRMFATALFNYSIRNGHYPGYMNSLEKRDRKPFTDPTLPGSAEPLPVSWVVLILPDIDRQDLYEQWRDVPAQHSTTIRDSSKPTTDVPRLQYFTDAHLEEFLCPSDSQASKSGMPVCYVVNTGMTDLSAVRPAVIDPDGTMTFGTPRDWAANGMFFDYFTTGPRVNMKDERVRDPKDKTILLTENVDATSYVFRAATHGADGWRAAEIQTGCIWRSGQIDATHKPPTMTPPVSSLQPNVDTGKGNGTSYDYCRRSSRHPQGFNVAFVGQNVQFLRDNISYYVFAKLMASDDANVRVPGESRNDEIDPVFRTHTLTDDDVQP